MRLLLFPILQGHTEHSQKDRSPHRDLTKPIVDLKSSAIVSSGVKSHPRLKQTPLAAPAHCPRPRTGVTQANLAPCFIKSFGSIVA